MTQAVKDKTASPRLREREEKFAQCYAETGSKLKAYQFAGYKSTESNAIAVHISRLMHRPKIIARIDEYKTMGGQTKRQAHELFSREWTLHEHERLKELALAQTDKDGAPDITNATRNLEGIGRIGGYYTETINIDSPAMQAIAQVRQQQADLLADMLAKASLMPGMVAPGTAQREIQGLPMIDSGPSTVAEIQAMLQPIPDTPQSTGGLQGVSGESDADSDVRPECVQGSASSADCPISQDAPASPLSPVVDDTITLLRHISSVESGSPLSDESVASESGNLRVGFENGVS